MLARQLNPGIAPASSVRSLSLGLLLGLLLGLGLLPEDALAQRPFRLSDPFLPGRYPAGGVRFPTAVQLVQQLGGRVELEHDGAFGTAIAIVLPA